MGSPIHSNESVAATVGGTVEPLIECTKGTKDKRNFSAQKAQKALYSFYSELCSWVALYITPELSPP